MTLARSGLARAGAAALVGLALASCAGRSGNAAPSTTATARSGGGSKGAGATTRPDAPAIHPELAAEIPAIAGVDFAATDRDRDYKTLRLPPRAHLARRGIEV